MKSLKHHKKHRQSSTKKYRKTSKHRKSKNNKNNNKNNNRKLGSLNKNSSKRSRSKNKSHKKNKKQSGGYKTCSLGYAMVPGMTVPAINNVDGSIDFPDVYAPIGTQTSCNTSSNVVSHPTISQPNYN